MANSGNGSKGGGSRHVVPNPGGGWDNKRGGGDRASSHHDTKQLQSIARGTRAAAKDPS